LLLSALVLLCCSQLSAEAAKPLSDSPVVVASNTATSQPVSGSQPALPEAPVPKGASSAEESIEPASHPFVNSGVKPAARGSYETARQRKIWYGLMAASHSSAAFDAWTTRRAVSGGYGVEGDPLMSPFAHSGAIYAATQVSPVVMDYLGHRMMTSNHEWMRRMWWFPQTAGASVSFSAGFHNYRMVH
jgi:hypothetical protein